MPDMFTGKWTQNPVVIRHGIEGGMQCPDCDSRNLSCRHSVDSYVKRMESREQRIEFAIWQFECMDCYCAFSLAEPRKDK